MNDLPYICALCPTYRRPDCLRNSLWLWEKQTYPSNRRFLIILDDGGTWKSQHGENWMLFSVPIRYTHFPQKYNALTSLASSKQTNAFLIWEDDDVYLPGYVAAHANVLKQYEYSKSKHILSNYPGHLQLEASDGRFFSSIGLRKSLLERVGGFGETLQADYDQQFLAKLQDHNASWADPWANPKDCQYVYGWQTGHHHAQSVMKSPQDASYYKDCERIFFPVLVDGPLESKPMQWTLDIFKELGYET